jgi:hypothetical protein
LRCRLRGRDAILGEALVRSHDESAEVSQNDLPSLRVRVELGELRWRQEIATPAEKRER